MPIELPPISRRQFLGTSLATGISLVTGSRLLAEKAPVSLNSFALLADTHISANRKAVVRNANMYENLRNVGREIISREIRPAAVLIDGDCAYLDGKSDDYTVLVELLQPVREAGMPVHLSLGNHDHRERFREALSPAEQSARYVTDRHITVHSAPQGNWFLLDSLDETNKTPGVLGKQQLQWLDRSLSEHNDKPALIFVHHNPDDRPNPSGLVDTQPLRDVVTSHAHTQAVVFGHTHNWNVTRKDGIHWINLPPVAYVFREGHPNGWVHAELTETCLNLELRCLDPNHDRHGETKRLEWRNAS